jgi:hypothetical protein
LVVKVESLLDSLQQRKVGKPSRVGEELPRRCVGFFPKSFEFVDGN